MKKIKMLAVDLDGTALNHKGQLSKRNLEDMQRAFDNGLEIVVASGRARRDIPEDFLKLPLRYMICKNGAILYDMINDTEIYHDTMKNEDMADVINFLKDKNGFVQAEYDNCVYQSKRSIELLKANPMQGSSFTDYLQRIEVHPCEDLASYLLENDVKIDKMMFHPFDAESKEAAMAYQTRNINLSIMDVGDDCIDISSRMVSKGMALKVLAQKLGISKSDIAAIGDSDNDMLMLTYAGFSFAMGNGSDFLKSFADIIAPSNDDDGLAWAIDQIIEMNKKAA